MKCDKCKYGDVTIFQYCFCYLFGVKVYQSWDVECCYFSDDDEN